MCKPTLLFQSFLLLTSTNSSKQNPSSESFPLSQVNVMSPGNAGYITTRLAINRFVTGADFCGAVCQRFFRGSSQSLNGCEQLLATVQWSLSLSESWCRLLLDSVTLLRGCWRSCPTRLIGPKTMMINRYKPNEIGGRILRHRRAERGLQTRGKHQKVMKMQ